MPTLHFQSRAIPLAEGQSVLEALLSSGALVPNSCHSGICQSCLLRLEGTDIPIPAAAQSGLKDTLRAQGYFLACTWRPTVDLAVALPGEGLETCASVLATEDLGAAVRRILLGIPAGFTWRAGQFITILREDGIARSYSIASRPEDGFLELHVRRIPGGAMSNWLHDDVHRGATLAVRGPFGECFYADGEQEDTLLLAGTGTGLAPLLGILRDALARGHRGAIQLYHGAVRADGLYLREELADLQRRHDNVRIQPVVLRGDDAPDQCAVGALDDVLLSRRPTDSTPVRAFLCGDPALVKKMKKRLFLAGVSNRSIFADPFVPSAMA